MKKNLSGFAFCPTCKAAIILAKAVILAFALFSAGCNTLGQKNCPYAVEYKSVSASGENSYENAGVDYTFFNSSEKTVASFTIVFYIYAEDNSSAFLDSNCLSVTCSSSVAPHSEVSGVIPLDDYVSDAAESAYQIDFAYVSEINYADGGTWRDLFGLHSF